MFYIDAQRTVSRRDSSLIVETDPDDVKSSTPVKSCEYPETVEPHLHRPWGSVRREVITSLFESMVGCIVESWHSLEIYSKKEEFPTTSSNTTTTSKTTRRKSIAVKILKVKKSHSKHDADDAQSETRPPESLLELTFWSGPNERAVIHFKNGNVYEGNISCKCMHGQGRMQWADGTVYMGKFKDNEINGRGKIEWKDETWYEGEFAKNIRHGRGVYGDSRTQRFYVGDWHCGAKHGRGFISYGSNNSYDGDWVKNFRHGFGNREYSALSGYSGCWDMSVRSGSGMMIWPNHDFYKGGWKNGVMHGYGYYIWDATYNHTMSLPNHNTYRGYWDNGYREGFGFLDLGMGLGSHYKGNFTQNQKNGRGKLVTNNGLVLEDDYLYYKDILGPIRPTEIDRRFNLMSECWLGDVQEPHEFQICDDTCGLLYHVEVALSELDNEDEIRKNMVSEFIDNNIPSQLIVSHKSAAIESTDVEEGISEIKDLMAFEEEMLRKSIRCYEVELKSVYYKYATICNTEEICFTPILIRLYLWQFYYDINIHKKGLTLLQIDNLFHANKDWLLYKPHYPFERIYYWQFLHSLILVAKKLYGKRRLPGPKPDTMVASAFRTFIENHILPVCKVHSSKGRLTQEFGRFVPLKGLYDLYCKIGEPHTVRQFLCAVRRSRNIESLDVKLIEAPDNLPPLGQNMYIFGDWMTFIPDEQFTPEPFKEPLDKGLYLFNFANLTMKCIINIFAQVLPQICHGNDCQVIMDLDVQITFYEFFEVFVACAEESNRMKEEEICIRQELENVAFLASQTRFSRSIGPQSAGRSAVQLLSRRQTKVK